MSNTPALTITAQANKHLIHLEGITFMLAWIFGSIKFQLEFDDADFNQFQYLISRSLLGAAEDHVQILVDIRITSNHTIMNHDQNDSFIRLMRLVETYERDIIAPEAELKARVRKHAPSFPVA